MKKIFTLALLAVFALVSCTPNSKDPVDPYPEACDKHDVDLILSEVGGTYFDVLYSEVPGSYNYNVFCLTTKMFTTSIRVVLISSQVRSIFHLTSSLMLNLQITA